MTDLKDGKIMMTFSKYFDGKVSFPEPDDGWPVFDDEGRLVFQHPGRVNAGTLSVKNGHFTLILDIQVDELRVRKEPKLEPGVWRRV
jgi:hypothetical protein